MYSAENQVSLHMTVAAAPDYDGEIDISSEIRLLKTALMYADKVTFISLTSSMLIQTLQAISAITNDELLDATMPQFGADERLAYERYVRLKRKKRKTKHELIILRRLQERITRSKKEMYEGIEQMAADAGLDQLVQPYEAGMLDFSAIDMSSGDFKDEIVWQYFEKVPGNPPDTRRRVQRNARHPAPESHAAAPSVAITLKSVPGPVRRFSFLRNSCLNSCHHPSASPVPAHPQPELTPAHLRLLPHPVKNMRRQRRPGRNAVGSGDAVAGGCSAVKRSTSIDSSTPARGSARPRRYSAARTVVPILRRACTSRQPNHEAEPQQTSDK